MKIRALCASLLILVVTTAMLGVSVHLHPDHGPAGDRHSGNSWSCDQCRIAHNLVGDLGFLPPGPVPSISFTYTDSPTTIEAPVTRYRDQGSPRAPPFPA